MTTFNTNFDHQREIDNLRRKMEIETRMQLESQGERKQETIDKEIAYRWNKEEQAIKNLSEDELRVVWGTGMTPNSYLMAREDGKNSRNG